MGNKGIFSFQLCIAGCVLFSEKESLTRKGHQLYTHVAGRPTLDQPRTCAYEAQNGLSFNQLVSGIATYEPIFTCDISTLLDLLLACRLAQYGELQCASTLLAGCALSFLERHVAWSKSEAVSNYILEAFSLVSCLGWGPHSTKIICLDVVSHEQPNRDALGDQCFQA